MEANIKKYALSKLIIGKASNGDIAKQCNIAVNTVRRYRRIFYANPIDFEQLTKMLESEVEAYFTEGTWKHTKKILPDWNDVHVLNKGSGYLYQIWEEYFIDSATHYQYSRFAALYKKWCKSQSHTIYHDHIPGEHVQVDFCGKTLKIIDYKVGSITKAQIFVGVLPYSKMAFVTAVPDQKLMSWLRAHTQMFEYFGGVSRAIIPDNLKAAVTKSGKEPLINRSYRELGLYYRIDIQPARPYKPKDKAIGENTVGVVSRWIIWRLKRQNFFSIDEINQAIAPLLMKLNSRLLKGRLNESRWSRFVEKERHLLQALPNEKFEVGKWLNDVTVREPYYALVENHNYSVPYQLVGGKVTPKKTEENILFYHDGKCVAKHPISYEKNGRTIKNEHRSTREKAVIGITYSDAMEWAESLDPSVVEVVVKQFKGRSPNCSPAKRACFNLQKLAQDYSNQSFILACQHQAAFNQFTYTAIKKCLQHKSYLVQIDAIQTQLPIDFRGSQS